MKRRPVDWDALAVHYRAGIRSLKDIGAEFEVSDAAIIKHARNHKWTRDLKGKIQARADAKVSAAMVSEEVSALTKLTEQVTVEVEATVQARIRIGHRKDIGKARTLAMSLLSELEYQTGNLDLYQRLTELLEDPAGSDDSAAARERQRKRLEVFEKTMSLGGRTKTMKDLGDTLKTLIGLEREAYGLEVKPDGDGSTRGSVSYKANIPTRS